MDQVEGCHSFVISTLWHCKSIPLKFWRQRCRARVEFAAIHATCELVCSALGFGAGLRHRDVCKCESQPEKASRGCHSNIFVVTLWARACRWNYGGRHAKRAEFTAISKTCELFCSALGLGCGAGLRHRGFCECESQAGHSEIIIIDVNNWRRISRPSLQHCSRHSSIRLMLCECH